MDLIPTKNIGIRTAFGPLGLRSEDAPPRERVKMQVGGASKTIGAGWLKGQEADEAMYQKCVKQAMSIAAAQVRLLDSMDPTTKKQTEMQPAMQKIHALLAGTEEITVAGGRRKILQKVLKSEERPRHLLVKFSKKTCCSRRERGFIIENGEIKVFRSFAKQAPITKDTIALTDIGVKGFIAEKLEIGTLQRPRFENGFDKRIKVLVDKRELMKKNPMFLYPKTDKELKSWQRAHKMAHLLAMGDGRKSMKAAIGRATSQTLIKAYNCLCLYSLEMRKTRDAVKTMAAGLARGDLGKGWHKLKLIYMQDRAKERKKLEQQEFAARFMMERLGAAGNSKAKPLQEVREEIITRIQSCFRRYREQQIFDRKYPIGTSITSRMKKARTGMPFDVSCTALSCGAVLGLSLCDEAALEHLKDFPLALHTKKATYTEASSVVAAMDICAAENFQNIHFFRHEDGVMGDKLSKTEFSDFINVDRISCLVVHTAPKLGTTLHKEADSGVWCTVHGPRLAYGKKAVEAGKDAQGGKVYSSEGASDAFGVAKALAAGKPVSWVLITVSPSNLVLSLTKQGQKLEPTLLDQKTYMVLHVLGYSFQSRPKESAEQGQSYSFASDLSATVPIALEDGSPVGLVALDSSEVAVEVYALGDYGVPKLLVVGSVPLVTAFGINTFTGRLSSKESVTAKLDMQFPQEVSRAGKEGLATLDVALEAEVQNDCALARKGPIAISPEFAGGGAATSLYTSHRGAWYDPDVGAGHFRVDHVPNFVELKFNGLHLQQEKGAEEGSKPTGYRIRASIGGVSVTSRVMHKPKASWRAVVGSQYADPEVVDFAGTRLCLPLPPGCWGQLNRPADAKKTEFQDVRPLINIEILQEQDPSAASSKPVTYEECLNSRGGRGTAAAVSETGYHTTLSTGGMFVDQVKHLNAFLAKGRKSQVLIDANLDTTTGQASESLISLDIALRDRDYIRCSMGKNGEERSLYVGDKVMIATEEPLEYPATALEFRQRFCHGKFSEEHIWENKTKDKCPLRDPCTSGQYVCSGLEGCTPKVAFRQSSIPDFCQDLVPHKFVLPLTEHAFEMEKHPGVFHRVIEDLSAKLTAGNTKTLGSSRSVAATVNQRVVKELTHTIRQIPATLLAVYPNGTCDLELAPEFIDAWRRDPKRKYYLPGPCTVRRVPEAGYGPLGQLAGGPPRMRAMLCGIPTVQVNGTHAAGFHVYDSRFRLAAEALNAEQGPSIDVNLRSEEPSVNPNFTLAAGPLPQDASPSACTYEWSLSVRAGNNYEMYEFVSMLRQLVRCDQLSQATKIDTYHTRAAGMVPAQTTHTFPPTSGSLEIVLVQARRLKPFEFESTLKHHESVILEQSHLGPLREETTKGLMGTKAAKETSSTTPDGIKLTTFVEFRVNNVLENGESETVPIKGEKVQISHKIEGTDSPSWASLPELQNSGGWTFKTGVIDRQRTPELYLDFEVKWVPQIQGFQTGGASSVGAIQIPVFQNKFLSDPQQPFKNLWLPLATLKDGQAITYPGLGEINIMARWIPPEKIFLPRGEEQITMRAELEKLMAPSLEKSRLKEPIYNFEAQYLVYNPNLVREGVPETPADNFARNAEEMYSIGPYLDCIDKRQDKAWADFERRIFQQDPAAPIEGGVAVKAKVNLSDLRQRWHSSAHAPAGDQGDGSGAAATAASGLQKLDQLVKSGIPSGRRNQFWLDLTKTDKAMESSEGAPDRTYMQHLQAGDPQQSDGNLQLREDAFHLAGMWESSRPPNFHAQDALLQRMRKAQNVCAAIIAMPEASVDYCESLLVLAFFLQLPQGVRLPKFQLQYTPNWVEALQQRMQASAHSSHEAHKTLQVTDCLGNPLDLFAGSSPPANLFPLTILDNTQKQLSESDVFWLLLTLVSSPLNGSFIAYYGKGQVWTHNAPMNDVNLLEAFLAGLEPKLYRHLSSIGFHLSRIFYGAFARLFATYMPTATVFRFWDILFAETTRPLNRREQPGRAGRDMLVCLAYAVIRSKRDALMLCQSGCEARHLLLGVLGSLYDANTVVDMVVGAHHLLLGISSTAVATLAKARALGEEHEEAFRHARQTTVEQNELLKQMMHSRDYVIGYGRPPGQGGVTTTMFMEEILPHLQQGFKQKLMQPPRLPPASNDVATHDGALAVPIDPPKPSWAMYRPMPLSESVLLEDALTKLSKHWNKAFKPALPPCPYTMEVERCTVPNVKELMEPFLSQGDLAEVLQMRARPWTDLAASIWKAFTNRRDHYMATISSMNPLSRVGIQIDSPQINDWLQRTFQAKAIPGAGSDAHECMSVNEFIIALIFCSRGTLGTKVAAAFAVFADSEPISTTGPFHILEPSRLAVAIAQASDQRTGLDQTDPGKLAAPDESTRKNSALRFVVKSAHWKQEFHNTEDVGEVFIPKVGAFVGVPPEDAEIRSYLIWPLANAAKIDGKAPKCVGQMKVAISWVPTDFNGPEGQLCIRLQSIFFFGENMTRNARMNPWVEVSTVNGGKDEPISRWDPRKLISHTHASAFKVGAFGGHIKFDMTMRIIGETFHHLLQHGENSGWITNLQEWQWNETWGKQLSVTNFRFPFKGASELPKSKNVMSLVYARYITQCVLQRSVINVSNRQALLIADSIFNRLGTVPGILGALLVAESDAANLDTIGLEGLRQKLTENRSKFEDVTERLFLEQERQMADNGGSFNLFNPVYMAKNGNKITLEDMNITDPIGNYEKVLIVRFVRGGDGERVTQSVKFDGSGTLLPNQELKLDACPSSLMASKVTKEEFINCFLNSAVLGEALRRMGSSDHSFHSKRPMQLAVTIVDPHGDEEQKEAEFSMNIHQSVLLEVWDDDTFKKDLLGEAFLPPLSELGHQTRDIVLPLKMPDFSDEADHGPSRPAKQKENLPKDIVATGEVYVKVHWEYPLYMKTPDGRCVPKDAGSHPVDKKHPLEIPATDRAKQNEMMNTGRLTLTIDHAKNLRRSDAKRGRDCDPQVIVWLRNDVMGKWWKKPLKKTSTIKNDRNPKWPHEVLVQDIMQGDYENRFPAKDHSNFEDLKQMVKTRTQKRHEEETRNLLAVKKFGDGLKLKFGARLGRGPGENHQVEMFVGDTIREFKAKLTEACQRECQILSSQGQRNPDAEKFQDVKIGAEHLVMVFVAPSKLSSLFEQGLKDSNEYKHAYDLATQDPNNWEPLDPTRSFDQYNPRFSFGKPEPAPPQALRVVEATEKYKLVNLRYRHFDDERKKMLVTELNEPEQCFGWAKYTHEGDTLAVNADIDALATAGVKSFEWRPATIFTIKKDVASTSATSTAPSSATSSAPTSAPASASTASSENTAFKVSWLVKPSVDAETVILDRASVLLAPRMPKLDHFVHPKHQELLKQAPSLRAIGKSDYEIEAMLNKIIEEQSKPGTGVDKAKMSSTKPPRITVAIIRAYMAHNK